MKSLRENKNYSPVEGGQVICGFKPSAFDAQFCETIEKFPKNSPRLILWLKISSQCVNRTRNAVCSLNDVRIQNPLSACVGNSTNDKHHSACVVCRSKITNRDDRNCRLHQSELVGCCHIFESRCGKHFSYIVGECGGCRRTPRLRKSKMHVHNHFCARLGA